MGVIQGLTGVGILLSGAGMIAYAISQLMNNTNVDLAFGWGMSGAIALILGGIMVVTNK